VGRSEDQRVAHSEGLKEVRLEDQRVVRSEGLTEVRPEDQRVAHSEAQKVGRKVGHSEAQKVARSGRHYLLLILDLQLLPLRLTRQSEFLARLLQEE
jgi:hypothetical protein